MPHDTLNLTAGAKRMPLSRGCVPLRSLDVIVRRVPLTLSMAAVILTAARRSGALGEGTPPMTTDGWGFSLANLRRGRLHTALTADALVVDRRHLRSILAMLVGFVAPLEALVGPKVALTVFWSSSFGASLGAGLVVAAVRPLTGWDPDPDMVTVADVGASAGTWGAAGALAIRAGRFGRPIAWPLSAGLGGYLLVTLARHRGAEDLAHLLGFAVGALVAANVDPSHPS